MAGRLGAYDLTAATPTTIYRAQSTILYTVVTINVVNRNSTDTNLRLALTDQTTASDSDYIEYDAVMGANNTLTRTGIVVGKDQRLIAESSGAQVTVIVTGVEVIDSAATAAVAVYSVSHDSTVTEGQSITFTVTALNAANGTALTWTVINGTTSNADFAAVTGSTTVTAESASFTVSVNTDSAIEGGETFTVRISNALGQTLVNTGTVTVINAPITQVPTFTLYNPRTLSTGQNDNFGNVYTLAIQGNSIYVGAYGTDDGALTDSGRAYIFNATTGSLVTTINNRNSSGTGTSDRFGRGMAANTSWLCIGADGEEGAGADGGVVHVYDAAGNFTRTYQNPAYTSSSNQWGQILAVSGNTMVVGMPNHGTRDRAHVYDLSDVFAPVLTILDPDNATANNFGTSVAVSGNYVAVGAPNAAGSNAGRVYVFDRTTGTELYRIDRPSPAATNFWGSAIAADGDYLVVGSSSNTNPSVRVYDIRDGTVLQTLANPNLNNASNIDAFGTKVGIDATNGTVTVMAAREGATSSGAVYTFDLATGSLGVVHDVSILGASIASVREIAVAGKIVAVGNSAAPDITGNFSNSGRVAVYTLP